MILNLQTKKRKTSRVRRINLILRSYSKIKNKIFFSNKRLLNKKTLFTRFYRKIKKEYPKILTDIPKKTLFKKFKSKFFYKKKNLKQKLPNNNKFLTKRFKKILIRFSDITYQNNTKFRIKKRLFNMNRVIRRKRMSRNLRKRSYFFRIIRKKRRHKLKSFRLNRTKPIFTKKTKKETKFLLRARESLLKTKKFLYRKKFPKIKGKKNRNFNFFYYNNMDRVPFKFNIGRIVITYLLNNTFINIHNSKKMLKVISAGKLKFKGPKRSTAYSRQIVARKAINYVARTKMNVLDIFLNSNYNRWYYFLFKEFSKPKVKPYVVRYLVISNSRPHGFIRDRKHRRK